MSLSLSLLAYKMGIILNWLLRELNEMIHANLLALSLAHSVEVVLGPWVSPRPVSVNTFQRCSKYTPNPCKNSMVLEKLLACFVSRWPPLCPRFVGLLEWSLINIDRRNISK